MRRADLVFFHSSSRARSMHAELALLEAASPQQARKHSDGMDADKASRWLTPELRAEYERDGYVVMRGYLTASEVELVRTEADRAMVGFEWYPGFEGTRKNVQLGDVFFGAQLIKGAHVPILTALVGHDLVPSTCAFFDKPLEKSNPIEPHRDGGGPMDGATIWMALDAADASNGCLHYTPGSHRTVDPSLPAYAPPPQGRTGGVAVPVQPGDVIVHSARCIHYSEQASVPRRRRAVSYFYWSGATARELEAKGQSVPGGWASLS